MIQSHHTINVKNWLCVTIFSEKVEPVRVIILIMMKNYMNMCSITDTHFIELLLFIDSVDSVDSVDKC